ncbi:reverse transcriptase domain-containing protein [Tanacetum coccineum]
MDRVISNEYKEEPETLDLLVKDVNLLNYDTPLETVYDEFCQHGWGKNEEKESSDGGCLIEYGNDMEEINATMNSYCLTILDDALPLKEKTQETVKRPKGIAENVLVGIIKFVFPVDFIVLDMPEDINVPLILGRPFLSTAYAKIDVFERKISLGIGNDKMVFKSDNSTSSIIKKVYVLGLRQRMELDLEARLMGEALILNRSQDPEFRDFLELNNLNKPLELRRNQEVNKLGPTIEEEEVIDKPMVDIVKTRHDDENIEGIDECPNFCDYNRKWASCVEARWFNGFITIHKENHECICNYGPMFDDNDFKYIFDYMVSEDAPFVIINKEERFEEKRSKLLGTPQECIARIEHEFDIWARTNGYIDDHNKEVIKFKIK